MGTMLVCSEKKQVLMSAAAGYPSSARVKVIMLMPLDMGVFNRISMVTRKLLSEVEHELQM